MATPKIKEPLVHATENGKSLQSWIWDAACSIRGAKDASKYKEFILPLIDVEPDIIGRSYEYLFRKFAEGSGQSAGEFYTPAEVGLVMAHIMDIEPGMDVYDPCCGSAGLLIKCELVLNEKMNLRSKKKFAPAKLHG